ncbi:Mob1/phocein family protein [Spironucleus salmonicida]|uniref:Mob1/phocein family protein n=1 Tax=Spironucleus salmonicida TaxID=348837 RepID=V6LS26_9EUKA|nr:Mob1/phocein family protein [Spironucleus salmonicida]|eukprot:EST47063.1 Mob1/phocein family protein [Spironucleus salmonicida]
MIQYSSAFYDNGVLNLSKALPAQPDTQQLHLAVREYLDSLAQTNPLQTSLFFEPPYSSPNLSKVLRYENFLFLLTEMSHLLAFLGDDCTRSTCPTMLATMEWKFLCTVHGNDPVDCCAQSYCAHFLDSGLSQFYANCDGPEAGKNYSFLERRSYRIIAHAYHHHKAKFLLFEKERGIYKRFNRYLQIFAPKSVGQMQPAIHVE